MNFKVITANINGIRSAYAKGFFTWLENQNADVVCLQEVRADEKVLENSNFHQNGYFCDFACAEKKGYSGVGIFSKQKPNQIIKQFNHPIFDTDGRFIAHQFDDLLVVSLYLHSGTTGSIRQDLKFQAMQEFEKKMDEWKKLNKKVIICGDINIVHTEQDIRNFKQNIKNSGCLPEERAWLDGLFYQKNWLDSFRQIKQAEHQYTWWSNRGNARNNNVGWRIDYQIISDNLAQSVKKTEIYTEEKFSDHAPYIVEYYF